MGAILLKLCPDPWHIHCSQLGIICLFSLAFSDMKNLIGEAICGICQESFSTTITGLAYLLSSGLHIEYCKTTLRRIASKRFTKFAFKEIHDFKKCDVCYHVMHT